MKKVKVITTAWPNKLEDQLNEYVGKRGYELKAVYFDSNMDIHIAVVEREE